VGCRRLRRLLDWVCRVLLDVQDWRTYLDDGLVLLRVRSSESLSSVIRQLRIGFLKSPLL
jgi:hypothetical protein